VNRAIAERIRDSAAVLLDLDGTLALGDKQSEGYRPLPGALELLAHLRRAGTPFAIFTNGTHHTPRAYVQMLRRAGFDIEESAMLTPAVVAADYFSRKRYRRVLVLGVQGVSQPLIDAGIAIARPGDDEAGIDAAFVGWHPDFALADIESACRVAWAGAPLYAASLAPFFATRGGKTIGVSSAICAAIRNVTGQRVTVLGKPSLLALRVAARRLGVKVESLLVVGDDPLLEIAMARAGHACAVGVTTGLADAGAFAALRVESNAHLVLDGIADLLPYVSRETPRPSGTTRS
jgi:NagD protein